MKIKKLLFLSLFLIIALLFIPYTVKAVNKYPEINKIKYVLDENTYTAAVTDYYGSDENLEIPSQIESEGITYKVTAIKPYASLGSNIKNIIIPASVTSIGREVFNDCTNLATINVEVANEEYCSVDGVLFNKDMTTIIRYPISKTGTTYNIPNTVKKIEEFAFIKCKSLKSITIPDSVQVIGMGAFNTCSSLTSVEIPDNVTSIEQGTFYQCTSLTTVTLPKNLQSIGNSAFFNCYSLNEIILPNTLEKIGNGAFSYCSKISDITIPNSVTSIESSAFNSCTSLVSATLSTGLTSIPNSLFAYCSSLKNITIPDSVTSIGNYAFENCTSLTSIVIPDLEIIIDNKSFLNCTSLAIYGYPNSEERTFAINNNINFKAKYVATKTLKNITSNNEVIGNNYTITLIAENGYELPESIIVKVGQNEITTGYNYDKNTGNVIIESNAISDDIQIIAEAVKVNTKTEDKIEIDHGTSNSDKNSKNNPQTGDNIVLYVGMLLISVVGIIVTTRVKRK